MTASYVAARTVVKRASPQLAAAAAGRSLSGQPHQRLFILHAADAATAAAHLSLITISAHAHLPQYCSPTRFIIFDV